MNEGELIYAGIGARETPQDVLSIMASIAEQLAPRWTLRSGYADGADQAFFAGANDQNGQIENYLPWAGFNHAPRNDPRFIVPEMSEPLIRLASIHHPAWDKVMRGGSWKLHVRNGCQILGRDLESPVKMVICWTKDGKGKGGTGQALRIAASYHIPIFDLALPNTPANLMRFVENMEAE